MNEIFKQQLIDALEAATNVKSICFDTETEQWTVSYKNGLEPDEIPFSLLIEWLNEG